MKIEVPEIHQENHRTRLSARIRVDHSDLHFPPEVWFSLRGKEQDAHSTMADPFLIGMLPIAMKLGEAITVAGRVSTRLAHGLEQYQQILVAWWPDLFKYVEIEYRDLQSRRESPRPAGVGCSFSGGVDSFYTVFTQLAPQPDTDDFRLTHALMVNGFDQIVDFEGAGSSKRLYDVYQPMLERLGVRFLMIDSNLKFFRDAAFNGRELARSYGSPLSACAHACQKIFGRFSLSGHGTYAYEDLEPYGSHPVLDHHLSTDQLQMTHYGSATSRVEKLRYLTQFPEVRESLRVCFNDVKFDKTHGTVVNCCYCEKCVRTIVTLDILGMIKEFKSFPLRFPVAAYMQPRALAASHDVFLRDNLRLARKEGRRDWAQALEQGFQLRKMMTGKKPG
jgi:hypothetical protein